MRVHHDLRELIVATPVAVLLLLILVQPAAASMSAAFHYMNSDAPPFTVQFYDDSISNVYKNPAQLRRTWTFDDGSTSTLQNPAHTFPRAGDYTVRLRVEAGGDEFVESDETEQTVTVQDPLTASFTYTDDGPLTVEFADTSRGTDQWNRWVWSFGDGSTSNDRNPVHVYPRAGIYTARLEVQGDFDDVSGAPAQRSTYQATVEVEDPLIASFTFEKVGGFTYRFTDTSTGNIAGRSWEFGDGATSTERIAEHTYTRPDSYPVRLGIFGRGDEFPRTRTNQTVVVEPTPVQVSPPVADFSFSPDDGKAPVEVTFTDRSTGADAWRWSFGDGSGSTERNPSHEFTNARSYDVSLTAVNSGGNHTVTHVVVVGVRTITTTPTTLPLSNPPTAAFTFEGDAANMLRVLFNDTSTGPITSWRWDFGDETTSTERNPIHVYPDERRNYIVRLTVEGPGGTATTVRTLRLDGLDTPPVTPTVTETTVPPTVTEVTVTPTDTGGGGDGFPWWVAAVVAVGLLAGGVAVAQHIRGRTPNKETKVPGMTIEARGGMRRPNSAGPPRRLEAEVEIEVRGGMRRER